MATPRGTLGCVSFVETAEELDVFIGERLADAGVWRSARVSDGISAMRTVEKANLALGSAVKFGISTKSSIRSGSTSRARTMTSTGHSTSIQSKTHRAARGTWSTPSLAPTKWTGASRCRDGSTWRRASDRESHTLSCGRMVCTRAVPRSSISSSSVQTGIPSRSASHT